MARSLVAVAASLSERIVLFAVNRYRAIFLIQLINHENCARSLDVDRFFFLYVINYIFYFQ